MKTVLTSLFEEFGYEPQDAAVLCEAYEQIECCPEAATCFHQALALYDTVPCDHPRMIALADEAARLSGVHEYTAELLLYLCLCEPLRRRYAVNGIAQEIFHDSMLDLRYKLEECKAVKGIVGSFVAFWFAGFFDLTRFALGRLQFEIIPFGAQYEKHGHRLTPDSLVINVHIPRTGTPLDEAACEESYTKAAAFFADAIDGDIAFVCYSWLLYPENKTILPPHSRIVRFMERYDVFEWHISKHRADLWRLFDTDEQHPDRLPTDTSARRAYVRHLQNGGKLGCGRGVFFWEKGAMI